MTTVGRRGSRGARVLFALLLGAFAAWIGSAREADFDFWYHLAAGRWIVEHGRIPTQDVFTHTAAGEHDPPTEWLFQTMIYAFETAFGEAGVVVYKTVFVAAWAMVLWGTAVRVRRGGARPTADDADGASAGTARAALAVGAIALGLLAAVPRYLARPEWVTCVGLALVFAHLRDEQDGRPWRGARSALVPAAILVWANAHAGVYFGVAMLGLFAATRGVGRPHDRAGAVRATAIAAAALVCSFASPAGIDNLRFLLAHANVFQRLQVEEFQPLPLVPALGFVWLYLVLATVLLAATARRLSLLERIAVPLFLVLAVRNSRLVPLFVTISAPLLPRAIETVAAFGRARLAAGRGVRERAAPDGASDPAAAGAVGTAGSTAVPVSPVTAGIAAILTVFACAAYRLAEIPRWGPIAFAVDESLVPRGAADFLAEHGVDAPLYNFHGFGNYLIWRGFRVSSDARLPLHEKTLLALRTKPIQEMERLGLTVAVVPPPGSPFFPFDGLAGPLSRRRTWALVHADRVAMVFLARGTGHDDLIASAEIPRPRPGASR